MLDTNAGLSSETLLDKGAALKQFFGYTSFREGQECIIDTLLGGKDVLAVMPTGAGKSLCYQIPALLLEGITLVVSPLIALMKDQVQALSQVGVAAAFINSSLSAIELNTTLQNAQQGQYKIIYVAPERLLVENFRAFARTTNISLIAIDEAHCVSQWGHDFRSSYRDIKLFIEELPKRPAVGAFTATATAEVKEDIIKLLELKHPFLITAGFDRENLYFDVKKPRDKDAALLTFVREHAESSGIIYCSTRNAVEEVCQMLQDEDFLATRYHAGLSTDERIRNQESFVHDRARIMVATNAFGMGIDKSNVSYVVHYNLPKNIESYYQEAGRAGRDGEPAICLLFYSPRDVKTNEFLISQVESENSPLGAADRALLIEKDLDLLKKMVFYCTTSDCLRSYILRYFGEQTKVFCGNCSNCNTKFEEVDISIDAQKIISCIIRLDQRGLSFGRDMVVKTLKGSKDKRVLQYRLDSLSTYGIMSATSTSRIFDIVQFLLEKELISQAGSEYPVLAINAQSLEFIRDKQPLIMQLPKEKVAEKPASTTAIDLSDISTVLFDRLKVLRRGLAEDANVPAYIVFSDATLRDMCRKLPRSSDEFLSVAGVGQKKLELYGKAFIDLIAEYCADSEVQD